MATITTRAGKGSPLTNTEVDDNFSNLNSAKYESGASPLFVNQLYVQPSDSNGTNTTHIAIGHNRTGNGYAHLDFVGDATWTDYGFRIIRNNNGPNASTSFNHNGTGDVRWTMMGGSNAFVINDGSHDSDFRVESNDNANMLFVDAADNFVSIGTSVDFGEVLNVNGGIHASETMFLSRQTNDTGSTGVMFEKTRNTTINGNTIVQNGDQLGYVGWSGNDGDQFIGSAYIIGYVDGVPGNNAMPTRLDFLVNSGGAAASNRMRLGSSGEFTTYPATGAHAVFNENSVNADFRVESDNSSHMLFIDAENDFLGVNWASPQSPLDVYGPMSSRIKNGGSAAFSTGIMEITTSESPSQIKITTGIPWGGVGSSTHAHTVRVSGYVYANATVADLQISWHKYNNSFYSRTMNSSGSWAPVVTLAVENNKVVIHLAGGGYWPKMYVESLYNAYGGSSHAQGWTWSDAAISSDTGTPAEVVPYKFDNGLGHKGDAGQVVFNEHSEDQDFRIETDSKSHAFFVDANTVGNQLRIGMGTSSITNPYSQENFTDLNLDGVWGGVISFKLGGTEKGYLGQRNSGNGGMMLGSSASENLYIMSGGNTSRMEFSSTGNVVINPTGISTDFTVSTDGASNAFFVDGSTNNLGMQSGTTWSKVGGGSGTSSSGVQLDMSYDGGIYAGSAYWAGGIATGTNFWRDASGWHYKRSARQSTLHYQNSQGGSHAFLSQTSGDAGALIAWNSLLFMDRTTAVFNDTGASTDFRVESDALSHCFFVDASENGVGIGDGTALANGLMISSSTGTTNAIDTKLYIYAKSSGTTLPGFGAGITFTGERNGDGAGQQMAKINARSEINSGTTLSSALDFQTATAGVSSTKVQITNKGNLNQNGVGRATKSGYASGNGTVSFIVTNINQSTFHVRCGFNHYGLMSYGSALDQVMANGSGGLTKLTATLTHSSGPGGGWTVTQNNTDSVTVTKTAGNYNGGGYYYIIVEGAVLT